MSGLQIGGGITFGGGISITEEAAATANSIVVAYVSSGYNYYGAINTTGNIYQNPGLGDIGIVTSDAIYALYYATDGSTSYTNIMLNTGTYTGFSVLNGVIDDDQNGYPRVFTIGGIDYTFTCSVTGGVYSAQTDVASLSTKVGETVTVVYDIAKQITLEPNTIIVGSYSGGPSTYYGASKEGIQFGTVISDYISSVSYDGNWTFIVLTPGTYTGFSVASDGTIDSDSSTARKFTFNGTATSFTVFGNSPHYMYGKMGDTFSLASNVGSTYSMLYDPNAQSSGGTAFVDGVSYNSSDYGMPGLYFSNGGTTLTLSNYTYWSNQEAATAILNLTTGKRFKVNIMQPGPGGAGNAIVTLESNFTIMGSDANASVSTDIAIMDYYPFSVTMEAPAPVALGTMTISVYNGQYGYGNLSMYPPAFGSSTIDPAMVEYIAYNPNGAGGGGGTQIMFINGSYGDVVVENSPNAKIANETFVAVTIDSITKVKKLDEYGVSGPMVEFTGDPFSLVSKNTQTLDVSIVAGTGTLTKFSTSGNFNSGAWLNQGLWRLTLTLESTPDSQFLTKLSEVNFGSPISITDNVGTTTVAAAGQANIVDNVVEIYTITGPTDNNNRYTIYSISLA